MHKPTLGLAIVACLLSALALARSFLASEPTSVSAAAPSSSETAAGAAGAAGADESEPTDDMERRVREIWDRFAALESSKALAAPVRQEVASEGAPQAEWTARIASLEKGLEAQRRELDRLAKSLQPKPRPGVEESIAVALDPRADADAKLAALGALRGHKLADGTDARVPVLDSMISIGLSDPDAARRADAWRQLSRVTDPRLRQPLLDALARDPDVSAREEAAESLAYFLPDTTVERALAWAADHDTSDKVRKQARESLRRR